MLRPLIIILPTLLALPQILKAQGPKRVLIKRVEKIINLDPERTMKPNLREATPDTSLFDLIDRMAVAGKLAIYDSEGHKLNYMADVVKPDTQTITDPVTGKEEIRIVYHGYFDVSLRPLFGILQTWIMDVSHGQVSVNTDMIGPVFIGPAHDNFPAYHYHPYWLKYEDVNDLIVKYEHNHNTRTIAEQIWNGYFYVAEKTAH